MLLGCLFLLIIALISAIVFGAISAFIFMLLWNFIAPAFGWSQVDFLQAYAITLIVCFVGGLFRGVTSE